MELHLIKYNGVYNIKPDEIVKKLEEAKDGDYKLIFKKIRNNTSNRQYRYYYGVFLKFWNNEGYSNIEADFHIKSEFAKNEGWFDEMGIIKIPSKSGDFDTKTMEEFLRFGRDLYQEYFGGHIPLPNESDFVDLQKEIWKIK